MAEQNMTQGGTRQFGNPVFREIHKNTWLKWVPTDPKKKKERVWVVFCIHDDTEAFLETYLDNKLAVLHKPDWFVYLNNTQHVSPTICAQDHEYEFVVTLSAEVIRLAAPTWEAMLEWVESLRGKLHELRILTPKENLYSKLPDVKKLPLLPTRDPTSPLPPPPTNSGVAGDVGVAQDHQQVLLLQQPAQNISISNSRRNQHPILQRGVSLPESSIHRESSSSSRSSNNNSSSANEMNITIVQVTTSSAEPRNIFTFDNVTITNSGAIQQQHVNNSAIAVPNQQLNNYERLCGQEEAAATAGPSCINRLLPPTQMQHRHRDDVRNLQPPAAAPSTPPPHSSEQPYLTLREHQVMQLQKEMLHPGGVRLQLRKKDCCLSTIALADANNSVWVCGWKQKENPMLYNALHIGDQLLNIEGIPVKSSCDASKVLRGGGGGMYVTIVVKRVPHGQVFVIHRESEGQPLGIVQEGNTAVIADVEAASLAARQGLSPRAPTADGLSFTNWVLTEINGRPLNLFFKESQVKDRLNAVGRDISILVQPLDLIKQLKKQLKSLRNYKDYILQ